MTMTMPLFAGVVAGGGGSGPPMPIDWVRSTGGDYQGGGSTYALAGVVNDAGNCAIASIWWIGDTPTLDAVTDTAGNTWIVIPGTYATHGSPIYSNISRQLAYCVGLKASAGNTVTAAWSADVGSYCGMAVHEFAGPTALDQSTSASGTTSPVSGGSLTPTKTHELIFVSQFDDDNSHGPVDSPDAGVGYTLLDEHAAGSGTWSAQWKVQEVIATVSGDYAASANVVAYAGSMISMSV